MQSRSERVRLAVPVGERDHVQGLRAPAEVTLVEYGDFECPYTRRARPVVRRLRQEFGDRLLFVFRNFPLSRIHPHAQAAAEAAEAAAAQGKFWEMHDYLYEHQQALDDRHLLEAAEQVGLDAARFWQEIEAHSYAARVREDFLGGVRSDVNGTPSFFINGLRHDDSYDTETLLAALERASARP
jgi:protein-disulfide isomerase